MINLLSNNVWSERDIVAHTEALVHAVTPLTEENVLMRKSMAAAQGQWVLTDEEMQEIGAYSAACLNAHQVGIQMRLDNEKLKLVIAYEAALARLALPVIDDLPDIVDQDGNTSPNPGLAVDIAEREAAQAVVDDVTDETLELWNLRHPVVEEPEIIPEPDPIDLVLPE